MDTSHTILVYLGILAFSILVVLILRAFVWWYFGIYEMLDRMDKNNNLLTDIKNILQKHTNVQIEGSKIKDEY